MLSSWEGSLRRGSRYPTSLAPTPPAWRLLPPQQPLHSLGLHLSFSSFPLEDAY